MDPNKQQVEIERNGGKRLNHDKTPGYLLMNFEGLFHLKLMKKLSQIVQEDESKPTRGVEPGYNTFFTQGLITFASVFLYESVSFYADSLELDMSKFQNHPLYKDLAVVRNNVHTFYKGGKFYQKSEKIVEEQLINYRMKKKDFLYFLRNDISLIANIKDKEILLLGTSYSTDHIKYESTSKSWNGEHYFKLARFVSSGINVITQLNKQIDYQIPDFNIIKTANKIELFDYKSSKVFKISSVTEATTFRLLLMLFQLSYSLVLFDDIMFDRQVYENDLIFCFFIKQLSITYDESFDNIKSLLKYSDTTDKAVIAGALNDFEISLGVIKADKFAQKLRNTLHYHEISSVDSGQDISNIMTIIIEIYLSNCGLTSMDEFRENGKIMIFEMRKLQDVIRKIVKVDIR